MGRPAGCTCVCACTGCMLERAVHITCRVSLALGLTKSGMRFVRLKPCAYL